MQFQGLTVTYPSPKGKRNKYFNQLRPGKQRKRKRKIIKKKGKSKPFREINGVALLACACALRPSKS